MKPLHECHRAIHLSRTAKHLYAIILFTQTTPAANPVKTTLSGMLARFVLEMTCRKPRYGKRASERRAKNIIDPRNAAMGSSLKSRTACATCINVFCKTTMKVCRLLPRCR